MTPEEKFDWLTDHVERPGKVALAVLRHHRPRGNEYELARCHGCDNSGDENQKWPCSTTRVVAAALSLEHILEAG